MSEATKRQLLGWIEQDRDALVDFFSGFVKAKSPNPPGDTREAAGFLCKFLDGKGIAYKIIAPQATMPNIVSSFTGPSAGRHLVLNGHIDVFPAGDGTGWKRDPWSGEVADGVVWGRGAADMKGGTSASFITYAYLHRIRGELKGKLTLTAVSDEETGGRWGTRYLLENHADECLGDCVLNGEPSSPQTVRFGEKGALRVVLTVTTPGAHGAYAHRSASATKIAACLIQDLEKLTELEPQMPDEVRRALAPPEVHAATEHGLGPGASDYISKVVVNVGVVRGGLKVNMIPGECVMELDIRIPIGLDQARLRAALSSILGAYPEVSMTVTEAHCYEPSWCDPKGEMLELIRANAHAVTGILPQPITTLAGTDCRYWRQRGIPAYVYGPSPGNMGTKDEGVAVDEFLGVVRTHVLSAYDYLMAPNS
ncbi:succinyl-diaminopimelate desuccinylase [Rhizobiales bacterium GAS191]|nr:succinyl-diaminopimelate desuccinylase [Rhizobiales bacterium GAS113]SEF09160.1 succinyl-diaminopimelate desuccinylase [Rhizobiales bacterium GAS191]